MNMYNTALTRRHFQIKKRLLLEDTPLVSRRKYTNKYILKSSVLMYFFKNLTFLRGHSQLF